MSKLGIIAALPAEAKCLNKNKLRVAAPVEIQEDIYLCLSGIGYESAENAAKTLLDFNVDSLISWGVAGALDPSLNSGDIILAESIISQDKSYAISTTWKIKLLEYLQSQHGNIVSADIASSMEICASVSDKENLLKTTGALAIDMESAAIAKIASSNNLDFLVLRSIADEASAVIPEAVLRHTDNLGNPEILKFVLCCILKPSQIKDIFRLAKSYKQALKSLIDIATDLNKQRFFMS